MADSLTPLTMGELDEFLVKLDKRKCPWCDGNDWGVHIQSKLGPDVPRLRALPLGHIFKGEDGNLKGTITTGTDSSLFVVAAECGECGYLYLFNYLNIMKKIREDHGGKTS